MSTPARMTPADHRAWIAARDQAILGARGTAQLAAHRWLDHTARPAAPAPGQWRAEGTRAIGTIGQETITLGPGDAWQHGSLTLIGYAREDQAALRVFDRGRARRLGIQGVHRAPYDPRWRVDAALDPEPQGPYPTESVDGFHATARYDGTLHLVLEGTPVSILVTKERDSLFAALSDLGAGEGYEFRMIRCPLPDAEGHTTIDLNRLYLPPSRLSPWFTCIRPQPQNRIPVAVPVGEMHVITETPRRQTPG